MNKLFLALLGIFLVTSGKAIERVTENDDVQAKIGELNQGDTLVFSKGQYPTEGFIIDKKLVLIAEEGVIIDAGGEAVNVFLIGADSVEIQGFEIRDVGTTFLNETAAIKMVGASGVVIEKNRIRNCFFGIYLEYSQNCEVLNNDIRSEFKDEASAGNAIHAWKCENLLISGNTARGHRDGIYFEFVNESLIDGNTSQGNLRYGLHFMFSHYDEYRNNRFENNGAGVAVMFSNHIVMQENEFVLNQGGASYGLLLKEISDGTISANLFSRNTIAILLEGANRLDISRNAFSDNGTAIDMKGNSLDNEVRANNFVANTFEVVTNTKQNINVYKQNYWSGYSGYDLDRDGVGDVPYRPVNVFAKITNQIPSATIMLHSSFVNLLEAVEKVFPSLIPVDLVDDQPKMRPYDHH